MLITKTKDTPEIHLSVEECFFEIKGSTYSENADEIFDNVAEWINENVPKIDCDLNCIFELDIISSISYKKILYILSILYKFYEKGKKITIIWKVSSEDEENLDFAEDLKELFKLPFKVVEK